MERRYRVLVCRGPECGERRNSRTLHSVLLEALRQSDAVSRCELDWQSCFGRCTQGPNVLVREISEREGRPFAPILSGLATLPGHKGGTALYNAMTPEKCMRVVEAHIGRGEICREYVERPSLPPKPPSPETSDP